MKKKEIKTKVRELLSSGTAKSEVFAQFSGQGIKDSQLAYFIAAHPDPARCDEHSGKIKVLIAIMLVQTLIAFLLGFGIGAKIGPNAQWIVAVLVSLIPLLFAWGFYKPLVGAYNAYIFLGIIQLPKSFEGFTADPVTTSIIIAINISILAFVWYVRAKIFPDFAFVTPKKVKGEYVFSG